MYLIYNTLLLLFAVLCLPWMAYRYLRGRLPGIGQRFGFIPDQNRDRNGPAIWLHAVSVGEVKAAASLIEELRDRNPEVHFVVTSSTRAGWETARQLLPNDSVLFPPLDLPWVCRRFLRRLRPSVVLVLETELWPNLFRQVKQFGAVLLLVNGRISEKAYPRYRLSRFLWRRVLALPDILFAQSEGDASKLLALGAPPEKVRVAGNLKFAGRPAPAPFLESLRDRLGKSQAGPIFVAGSTMPGEESQLLETFRRLLPEFPKLWMILAPRHPERFSEVGALVRSFDLSLTRRSEWGPQTNLNIPGVLLLDSIGELGAIYELATVAFVGGTLVPAGGHNVLEPAYFGRPIVIGPSMTNFQEIADQFLQNAGISPVPKSSSIRVGSLLQVAGSEDLALALRFLFNNPGVSRRLGEAARALLHSKLVGVAAVMEEVERFLPFRPVPRSPRENLAVVGAGKLE